MSDRRPTEARVEVQKRGDESRAVCLRVAVREGEVILEVHGHVVDTPGRHTLQIGAREHLCASTSEPPPAWVYLNHACAPNAWFRGVELVALRALAAGEELTFDYNATEYDLASPFECHCPTCPEGHVVRGYKHLTPAERARLGARVSPYLLELARREAGWGRLARGPRHDAG